MPRILQRSIGQQSIKHQNERIENDIACWKKGEKKFEITTFFPLNQFHPKPLVFNFDVKIVQSKIIVNHELPRNRKRHSIRRIIATNIDANMEMIKFLQQTYHSPILVSFRHRALLIRRNELLLSSNPPFSPLFPLPPSAANNSLIFPFRQISPPSFVYKNINFKNEEIRQGTKVLCSLKKVSEQFPLENF